jgi:uncharacterized protein
MAIETNLEQLIFFAKNKQDENKAFQTHLQNLESTEIDNSVMQLNDLITPQIDCTKCGNCCRSLMINVSEQEANQVADHLKLTRLEFDNRYIEKGFGNDMILNTIPCHFLSESSCTIYSNRFNGCREFPALHIPGFNKRLFTIFMHYDRCPIIYNVVEHLKIAVAFEFKKEAQSS